MTSTNEMTLAQQLAALKAENEALRAANAAKVKTITMKVSEKGGVSVYGLGRFPVTLYRDQWERLAEQVPAIQAFIVEHAAELKGKGEAVTAPPASV
jgi:hypothetical protein